MRARSEPNFFDIVTCKQGIWSPFLIIPLNIVCNPPSPKIQKSKEVTSALTAATEKYPPISKNPTDSDISSILELLTTILKGIYCDPVDSKHNIWVIIAPKDKYFTWYNTSFVLPDIGLLFDATISEEASNSVLHQVEAEHTVRRNYRYLCDAAKNDVVNFFLTISNDPWYQYLKDADAYYSEVTTTAMPAHLRSKCSSLHKLDAITAQGEIMDYFN